MSKSNAKQSGDIPATVTCTFQDGETHTVELDIWTEVCAADIRQVLALKTVHEAEAIQLFSTDGEGRELSDDSEIVPAGSELQVIVRDLQSERKAQLRDALARVADDAGRWCWVIVCEEQAHLTYHATRGDFLKLVQVNDKYYAFHTRIVRPYCYLLHENQFIVKWVKEGKCDQGRDWTGEQLERMEYEEIEEDEDFGA